MRRGIQWVLAIGWLLASVGYYGPWLTHRTAALSLSGTDLGEFVKFLPAFITQDIAVQRHFFYLPPLALVASVALLAACDSLGYPRPARAIGLLLALPVSLQFLPPAWSPSALLTAEFLPQTVALVTSWLLLAGFWLWRQLPDSLATGLVGALGAGAAALSTWQLAIVHPAIQAVYESPVAPGWGVFLCNAGLLLLTGGAICQTLRLGRGSS